MKATIKKSIRLASILCLTFGAHSVYADLAARSPAAVIATDLEEGVEFNSTLDTQDFLSSFETAPSVSSTLEALALTEDSANEEVTTTSESVVVKDKEETTVAAAAEKKEEESSEDVAAKLQKEIERIAKELAETNSKSAAEKEELAKKLAEAQSALIEINKEIESKNETHLCEIAARDHELEELKSQVTELSGLIKQSAEEKAKVASAAKEEAPAQAQIQLTSNKEDSAQEEKIKKLNEELERQAAEKSKLEKEIKELDKKYASKEKDEEGSEKEKSLKADLKKVEEKFEKLAAEKKKEEDDKKAEKDSRELAELIRQQLMLDRQFSLAGQNNSFMQQQPQQNMRMMTANDFAQQASFNPLNGMNAMNNPMQMQMQQMMQMQSMMMQNMMMQNMMGGQQQNGLMNFGQFQNGFQPYYQPAAGFRSPAFAHGYDQRFNLDGSAAANGFRFNSSLFNQSI